VGRNEDSDSVENLINDYTARRISRRQFFRRSAALGISLGAAGTLLAACGGDGEEAAPAPPSEEPAPPSEEPAPPPSEEPPAEEPPAAEPVVGGQLIEGYDRDFAVLDPVYTSWDDPGFVALYEFPVIRDADGAYQPALFDSWTVSDDLLTWTFKLPEGRVFHSGAAVDAQMVADNFNAFRAATADDNPDGPGQNSIFWPTVKDATASDPTTVVVTLNAPFTAFPETLATENSMIVNLATRRELGFPALLGTGTYGTAGADGTGPFTFGSYQPGTEVVVNRWDEYAGTNVPYVTNQGPAYLDSVKWVPILEAGQRANEIEGGTVHVVKNPAPQDTERLQGNSDLVVTSFPSLSNYFLGPNCQQTRVGFDDVNVRQAISMAIDRQSLVDSIFFGQAVATHGPIAPNYKWYEPGVEQFNQFDPEQAKSLLDAAGWTEGSDGIREKGGEKLSFSLTSNSLYQPTTAAIDQAIVPMLAEVGVEMKLNPPDAAEYFPLMLEQAKPENATKLDAWTFEWLWSSPVDLLIYFQAFPTKAWNGDLPEIAAAVEQWQTAPDIPTLEAAARAFQLAWAEQLPEIPILTRNDVWVVSKNVMSYAPFQAMLYPLYNDVWLAA
jgi:peptide/nickel transport system substrate-binding protein